LNRTNFKDSNASDQVPPINPVLTWQLYNLKLHRKIPLQHADAKNISSTIYWRLKDYRTKT